MANQNVDFGTGGHMTSSSRSETSGRSRREFLSTLGALGLTSVAPFKTLAAQTPGSSTRLSLIDTHHHIVPPFFVAENRERIIAGGGGRINPAYLTWTPEQAFAAMDKNGVARAVISLSASAFWFGDREAAVRTARRVNEYAADLVRSHKDRFGLFAIIPLPDTEASLREIDYAYSVLKADGIELATSYDEKWLGHPDYQPVFEELNRRKAVVFVHPTTPSCCRTLLLGLSRICFLPAPLRDSRTFALFLRTRAETCQCCSVVCTNTAPRTSPRRHPTESNTSSSAFITTSLARPINRRLRRSQVSSPPHRFCSGATIRLCHWLTRQKV
jgi:hypothetical protein